MDGYFYRIYNLGNGKECFMGVFFWERKYGLEKLVKSLKVTWVEKGKFEIEILSFFLILGCSF